MTSTPVAQLLVDLGVSRTHSRPPVSNDNPFSEAQFKTLTYCPAFPERFGSLADARDGHLLELKADRRRACQGRRQPGSYEAGTVPKRAARPCGDRAMPDQV